MDMAEILHVTSESHLVGLFFTTKIFDKQFRRYGSFAGCDEQTEEQKDLHYLNIKFFIHIM